MDKKGSTRFEGLNGRSKRTNRQFKTLNVTLNESNDTFIRFDDHPIEKDRHVKHKMPHLTTLMIIQKIKSPI